MSSKYVVILTAPVEEERCAMVALQLADLLNVSISKMTRLLSGRPGPLTKAIDKDKAEKLAKLLQRLDIKVAVVAETLEDTLLIPLEPSSYTEKKTKPLATSSGVKTAVAVKPAQVNRNQARAEAGIDLSFQPDALFAPRIESLKAEDAPFAQQQTPVENLKKTPPHDIIMQPTPIAVSKPSLKLPLAILFIIIITMAIVLGASYMIPQARGVENKTTLANTNTQDETSSASQPASSIVGHTREDLLGAATEGNAESQFELAWLYTNGLDGEQSYPEAAKWLAAAAKQNHPNAQYYLGLYYYFGHGLEQSYPDAARWLEAASKQGVGEAQLLLGRMYLSGEGVDKNLDEAKKWLYLADEQGIEEASILLNDMETQTKSTPFDASISPLFDLAQKGNLDEIKTLVAAGADLNIRDPYGQTPLMYAISSGQSDIGSLLDLGADANIQTDAGWTSLMYAARDNASVIASLLEHGADANLLNGEGQTAYDIALVNHPEALITLQTASPVVEPSN